MAIKREYTVLFEIFDKKLKATVQAENIQDAEDQIYKNLKIVRITNNNPPIKKDQKNDLESTLNEMFESFKDIDLGKIFGGSGKK